MQGELQQPPARESGLTLIGRSMAHLERQKLCERDWVEGQIMLGHNKVTMSNAPAPVDTGYLGRALEVTDAIIEAIERLCPGAFTLPHASKSGTSADGTGTTPEQET